MNLCECGCGGAVTPGKRFIQRHGIRMNYRTKVESDPAKITMSFFNRVTPEQIEYIKKNYHPQDRTYLAKELGIPKTIYNFVCIELGLRREA